MLNVYVVLFLYQGYWMDPRRTTLHIIKPEAGVYHTSINCSAQYKEEGRNIMATIREISDMANVSIATVSKVLNGKKGVSQETIDRILSIARELNYRPNLTARNLKNGKSHTLGVITEDLTVFNNPEIVDGIDAYCESNGYHYILEICASTSGLEITRTPGNAQRCFIHM